MKKILFGIFAHPDDEAFLPSGSFIKWVDQGADLHLICATKGERGTNPDNVADLGAERCKEWEQAGQIMGACSQTQLGFPDGELSNRLFHKIAQAIFDTITAKLERYDETLDIHLVTYENSGITGHLDHIAMSYITTYVFTQLQQEGHKKSATFKLLYVCACKALSPSSDISFVFMPKGHNHEEVDLTEDVTSVLERKKQAMRVHVSQRNDAETMITRLGSNLGHEHFSYFKD